MFNVHKEHIAQVTSTKSKQKTQEKNKEGNDIAQQIVKRKDNEYIKLELILTSEDKPEIVRIQKARALSIQSPSCDIKSKSSIVDDLKVNSRTTKSQELNEKLTQREKPREDIIQINPLKLAQVPLTVSNQAKANSQIEIDKWAKSSAIISQTNPLQLSKVPLTVSDQKKTDIESGDLTKTSTIVNQKKPLKLIQPLTHTTPDQDKLNIETGLGKSSSIITQKKPSKLFPDIYSQVAKQKKIDIESKLRSLNIKVTDNDLMKMSINKSNKINDVAAEHSRKATALKDTWEPKNKPQYINKGVKGLKTRSIENKPQTQVLKDIKFPKKETVTLLDPSPRPPVIPSPNDSILNPTPSPNWYTLDHPQIPHLINPNENIKEEDTMWNRLPPKTKIVKNRSPFEKEITLWTIPSAKDVKTHQHLYRASVESEIFKDCAVAKSVKADSVKVFHQLHKDYTAKAVKMPQKLHKDSTAKTVKISQQLHKDSTADAVKMPLEPDEDYTATLKMSQHLHTNSAAETAKKLQQFFKDSAAGTVKKHQHLHEDFRGEKVKMFQQSHKDSTAEAVKMPQQLDEDTVQTVKTSQQLHKDFTVEKVKEHQQLHEDSTAETVKMSQELHKDSTADVGKKPQQNKRFQMFDMSQTYPQQLSWGLPYSQPSNRTIQYHYPGHFQHIGTQLPTAQNSGQTTITYAKPFQNQPKSQRLQYVWTVPTTAQHDAKCIAHQAEPQSYFPSNYPLDYHHPQQIKQSPTKIMINPTCSLCKRNSKTKPKHDDQFYWHR